MTIMNGPRTATRCLRRRRATTREATPLSSIERRPWSRPLRQTGQSLRNSANPPPTPTSPPKPDLRRPVPPPDLRMQISSPHDSSNAPPNVIIRSLLRSHPPSPATCATTTPPPQLSPAYLIPYPRAKAAPSPGLPPARAASLSPASSTVPAAPLVPQTKAAASSPPARTPPLERPPVAL